MDWIAIIFISLFLAALFAAMELVFVSAIATRTEGDAGQQGIHRLSNIFYNNEEGYLTAVTIG